MIECRSKYYRAHLKTKINRELYDLILAALQNRQKEIDIGPRYLTPDVCPLSDMVLYVRMDNPGLFYVDFNRYTILSWEIPPRRRLTFSMLYEDDQIDRVEQKLRRQIDGIVRAGRSQNLTGYGMELFLHDYLALNVRYEYADKSYHKAHSSVGPLLHGRSVCEGYAMAFKLLCDAAGISCIVVFGDAVQHTRDTGDASQAGANGTARIGTGDPESGSHAWNIVKLEGKCYQVDTTWDSCRTLPADPDGPDDTARPAGTTKLTGTTRPTGTTRLAGITRSGGADGTGGTAGRPAKTSLPDRVAHTFFNLTDDILAIDHKWDTNLLPSCTDEADSYYVRSRTLFEDADAAVQHMIVGALTGKTLFRVRTRRPLPDRETIVEMLGEVAEALMNKLHKGISYEYSIEEDHHEIYLKIK